MFNSKGRLLRKAIKSGKNIMVFYQDRPLLGKITDQDDDNIMFVMGTTDPMPYVLQKAYIGMTCTEGDKLMAIMEDERKKRAEAQEAAGQGGAPGAPQAPGGGPKIITPRPGIRIP